jgi:hypothetical protein
MNVWAHGERVRATRLLRRCVTVVCIRVRVRALSPSELLESECEKEPTDAELARLADALEEALRAEVHLNRIKKHYKEVYEYQSSITPDASDTARRASTWIFLYLWWRGLFAVQYAGMDAREVATAVRARGEGYDGGMPRGAKIGAEEAFARWWEGERAYVDEADAFTEADVGCTLVVSGKYATSVSVDGVRRAVQWRGGAKGRPAVPKGKSVTYTLVSVSNGAVVLRAQSAGVAEASATMAVAAAAETTVALAAAAVETAEGALATAEVATVEVEMATATAMAIEVAAAVEEATLTFEMPKCDVRCEPLFVRLEAHTGRGVPWSSLIKDLVTNIIGA